MTTSITGRPSTVDALPIDPRFRARRLEIRRGEGRRRLRRISVLAGLLGVALVGYGATRTPLLDVDRVSVVGAEHTPLESVVAASGIRAGEAMTDVDVAAARAGIEELPWIEAVMVSRRWPSTVRVYVIERTPVAFVLAGDGRFALVDEGGRVLEILETPPAGLLALADVAAEGPAGSTLPASADDVLEVATAMPGTLRLYVIGVAPTKDAEGEVELRLGDGSIARLGRPDDLADKLVAVATVLSQVDQRCLRMLDVRVAASPVITRSC